LAEAGRGAQSKRGSPSTCPFTRQDLLHTDTVRQQFARFLQARPIAPKTDAIYEPNQLAKPCQVRAVATSGEPLDQPEMFALVIVSGYIAATKQRDS
jgi:hypothetical protein